MKAIKILYFYVALLPSIVIHGVHGDEGTSDMPDSGEEDTVVEGPEMAHMTQVLEILDDMVADREGIRGIFTPKFLIRRLGLRIIYEGKLHRNEQMVAMKFEPLAQDDLRKEYEMYTYLGAIDNATVENNGIPAVYYYGEWEGCRLLAITLFIRHFHVGGDWNVLNTLILLREFVRISKFMHSRGVYNRACMPQNILFRGNKAFMIHFKSATKAPNRGDFRREDWRSFITYMCTLRGLHIDQLNALPDDALQRVIFRFRHYILRAGPVDYDQMYNYITGEIHGLGVRGPILFSWLMNANQLGADSRQDLTPDIRAIPNPYAVQFDYTEPNYAQFA